MKFRYAGSAVALALLAGSVASGPVAGHPPPKPPTITVRPPVAPVRPPVTNVNVPRPTTTNPTGGPSTSTATGGPQSGDPATSQTTRNPVTPQTFVTAGGEDFTVRTYNVPLTENVVQGTLGKEVERYNEGNPNHNYRVLDPNSTPSRDQDCGGNVLEQVYGVKNVVVGASNFHDKIIKGQGVPEVGRSQVQNGDVGIMFYEDGRPGHIFYVKDAPTMTIISKDGYERARQGVLSENDDVHKQYRGDIKFYRIDPTTHKLVAK
jgi:hypothetical protein